MKDDRRKQILEVAQRLFLHFGFQKVTLVDIARELGVSRPTVYQAFSNKKEIFQALIEQHHAYSLERIESLRQNAGAEIGELLRDVIEIWTVEPFELLQSSPTLEEFQNPCLGFADDVIDQGYVQFEKSIKAILKRGGVSGDVPVPELAHFIVVSLRGFKTESKNLKELRSLIENLLALALPK